MTDGPTSHPHDPAAWRQAVWLLAAATALRLLLAAWLPLFPDEAYYWDWSRRLAGGYFDHPPLLAWLIAAGTALVGDTPFGVRVVPILAGSSGGVALVLAARRLAGDAAARYTALAFGVLPLAVAGLVLATPDAPLLASLSWTLHCVVRALDEPPGSAGSTLWWTLGGVAIGAAMTSKFTGVFYPLALVLAFAIHPALRVRFREPGPWVAVLVASLLMVPVLYWNAQHDWIAFRFQLGHGLGTNAKESLLHRQANLVGSQFALVTPILFVLVLAAIVRGVQAPWRVAMRAAATGGDRQEPTRFALAVIAAFCALFFVYSATRRNVEANWPAIAWLPALVLLGAARDGLRTAWERRALWLAGALSGVLVLHALFRIIPLPARRDQLSQAYGWDRLARSVDSARRSLVLPDGALPSVAANRYQDAGLLSFHLPGTATVSALNLGARRNQYDLWNRFADTASRGSDLLLVLELPREGLPGPIRRLTGHFGGITPGPILPLQRDGETVGRRQLWILRGWNGTWYADSTDPRAARD